MKYLHVKYDVREKDNTISNALRDAGHFVLDIDYETYQKHQPWKGFDKYILTNGNQPVDSKKAVEELYVQNSYALSGEDEGSLLWPVYSYSQDKL